MLALIKSRLFLVTIGLLLLALVIWFLGPYFAFADFRPLAGAVARLLAILLLAIAYAAYVQLRQLKHARASRQLASEVARQEGSSGGSGDAAQLRKRFEEAIETLRKARKKGAASLYELPWYIIVGPPGAGKTTVLVNSGLNFPLAQKFGKEALRGVGGTRNCDWWFTDEAILLDTAGRYITQDSDARADAASWSAFLDLLRKFRGRQPINGVIVAVSATDLLTLAEREREQHVSAIRERLDELARHLRINPPVYLLVTKCDLIAGFAEFFDDMPQEARAQVWGMTFPIEASEDGSAPGAFGGEFAGLIARLQQRVLPRLESERDPRRRAGVLAFPQQLTLLRPVLEDLLKRVFTASGFDRPVLLRGVYLTSGTQEGTPIDRMLGAIARTFGVTSAVAAPTAGRGKAYFIERLLKNVIFPESGLAGVNRTLQLRKMAVQSAAYIACLALVVLGLLWMTASYRANAAYIDEIAQGAKALQSFTSISAGGGLEARIPELDALRDLSARASRFREHVPWHMRAALYRGGSIGEEAREAYLRDLNAVLVPALRAQFERALQANVASPERLYEYLKAYLMLGDGKHRDQSFLRFMSGAEWRQMYPGDPTTAQHLAQHFDQLLAGDHLSSLSLDPQAVEQARIALRSASMPVLVYDQLKFNYADDTKDAVRLDIAAGTGWNMLVRRSGTTLSQPVPALYTRTVFRDINSRRKYELVTDFGKDSWVFGDTLLNLRNTGTLVNDVMHLYEADYIRVWDAIVKDVAIKSPASPQEFTEMLGVISSPASPLKGFLLAVAKNTNLLQPDTSTSGQAAQEADKLANAKLEMLKKLIGGPPQGAQPPGTQVTMHFQAIQQLVGGPPGQAPIDGMLSQLNQQYQHLASVGVGVGQRSPLDPQVQASVREAKQSLALVAQQLPSPLGSIVSEVASRTASIVSSEGRQELSRLYATRVVKECQELVEGRYPLVRTSPTEVALGDFAHVFGPGGVFDNFFRENLAQLVDTSRSPWRWREGAAAGPASMLEQFQRVQRIRDDYFPPGSQGPSVHFSVAADDLDASVTRFSMSVDGQSFSYQHGPIRSFPMKWPGAAGAASFMFDAPSGPVPGASMQGSWAWFRLLSQARIERSSDSRYRVTFTAGGKSMHLILETDSIRNPFARNDLAGFRCAM
ncbi:MAG: type VI secretion system membrane subunit TssM [Steroidobacteraceae bacterium]